MLELFWTNGEVYAELNKTLTRKLSSPFKILKSENGKPYIEGDPLFFSISHSRGLSLIAVSDSPVGADCEVITERKYTSVLSRFSKKEQAEIECLQDFLKHWVVREAYIKMLGATLSEKLNKLKYEGGTLFDNGEAVDCAVINDVHEGCVYSVCIDNKSTIW